MVLSVLVLSGIVSGVTCCSSSVGDVLAESTTGSETSGSGGVTGSVLGAGDSLTAGSGDTVGLGSAGVAASSVIMACAKGNIS